MNPTLPPIGATVSSQQFNQMNTASAPLPSNASASGGLPGVGETVSADQFKTLQTPTQSKSSFEDTETGKTFAQGVQNSKNFSASYGQGLLKTYAGAIGLNSDTGQWGMPDFLKEAESSKSTNPLVQVGEGALRAGGSLLNVIFAPISQAVSSAADTASDDPRVQNLANGALSKLADAGKAIQDLRDAHPEGAKDFDSAMAFLLTAGGGEELNKPIGEIFKPKTNFQGPTSPIEPPIPKEPVIEAKPGDVTLPSGATTDAATAEGLNKVASEWKSPTEQNVAGYKIPTAILEKSPEVPAFLAEQGLNPFEHIDENGRYATADTADSLRQNAGAESNSSMRAALKAADYSTPKTAVGDILSEANKYASNGRNVTADDLESVNKNLEGKIAALERKYPKGMSLENMHDERITYGKNGKFSPVGDKSVTNDARANRALADSLSKMVEVKAPKEIGYQAYNKYISNFYKAADYLDSLNTKKAPVSWKQKAIRTVAKLGMAEIFGKIPGGSLINEFVGYQVGKTLERAIENMTNPQRNAFLKDLKVTDPETFTKVQEFLKKNEKFTPSKPNSNIKELPPGKGSSATKMTKEGMTEFNSAPTQNIINLDSGKQESTIKTVPAKAISIKNPKTGKYEKAYTSESKSDKMIAEKYDYDPFKKVYTPKKK